MKGRPGRFLGDPIPDPRKRTLLEIAIEQEQRDIEAERQRQEFAQQVGAIMQGRGDPIKEPKR